MNTDSMQGVDGAGRDGESLPDAPAGASDANIHETLLEGVSADALAAHGGGEPEAAPPSGTDRSDATDSEPALAENLTVVPEAAAEPLPLATEAVATSAASESFAEVMPEPVAAPIANPLPALEGIPVAVPSLAEPGPGFQTLTTRAGSPRIGQVMGELGEVNATLLTYLRGEGTAALAHWQALSGARTPADALRIQVDEMQRAADASLSCFATLAKRAGRFTALIGRS